MSQGLLLFQCCILSVGDCLSHELPPAWLLSNLSGILHYWVYFECLESGNQTLSFANMISTTTRTQQSTLGDKAVCVSKGDHYRFYRIRISKNINKSTGVIGTIHLDKPG